MMRNSVLRFLLVIICWLKISAVYADSSAGNSQQDLLAFEYFAPLETSRDIETLNLNYDHLLADLDAGDLLLYFDLTASYATGEITQLNEDSEGDLSRKKYHNTAFGVGPGFFTSYRFYSAERWSFHLNGGWNVIYYNKSFPAGGDHYNFMLKIGPMFEYDLGKNRSLGINLLWTHVSNGQGLGNHNPSYEDKGIGFRLKGFF